MSDSPRLDRIEQIVISLEADMKIMASSVSSMAHSMEKFVEMQTDHKLLKQEMKHNCDSIFTRQRALEAAIEEISLNTNACETASEAEIERRFKEIEPLVFFVKYPKFAIMSFATLYLLSIKEVRDTVLPFI